MARKLQLILTIIVLNHCQAYYTWKNCPSECIKEKKSCTISQEGEGFFSYECYINDKTCLERAGASAACIGEDFPTKGGEKSWKDFEETNPAPPSEPGSMHCSAWDWKLTCIVHTGASALITSIFIIKKLLTKLRRRMYTPITATDPDMPEHPYQPTVENRDE